MSINNVIPDWREHPLRPPNWRARTAVALVQAGRPIVGARHDSETVRLVEYLRLTKSGAANLAGRRFPERLADIQGAVELREPHHITLAGVVEARVLARQTPREIAPLSGLPTPVVARFQELFFDVRDRLPNADYIIEKVILTSQSKTSDGAEIALKLAAYLGGPRVIGELLALPGFQDASDLAAVLRIVDKSSAALLDLATHVALRRERKGGSGSSRLAYAQRRAADRPIEAPLNFYERHLKALLDDVPFVSGNDALKDAPESLRPWLESPGELRDDELTRVASGQSVGGLDDLKKPLPLPHRRGAGPRADSHRDLNRGDEPAT